jgi:hypothetical protein
MLMAQTMQARVDAMTTANVIAVFFIVMMFQLIVYMYVRPNRSIWGYLIPFVVVAAMLVFQPILQFFIFIFREILPGDVSSIIQGTRQPTFVPLFIAMFFGAGLMEELMKAVPILFGYNMRADMPEDVVYKLLSAFYKNREQLAKADAGFAAMSKDFVGMQVNGIKANPQIPVHAGLAKFLKEHKAWDEKWKIATSGS